ncbi:hypothetical protein F4803DRAFT_541328 [Xylaria telfairii]|nr:hypothetical protein F4803DRAFT_541328 [Xylaria telfairii]
MGIQLSHRNAVILPIDADEKIAQRFDFRITLEIGNGDKTMGLVRPIDEAQQKSRWKDFELRLMRDDELRPSPATLLSTSATPPPPKLKVRWAPSINFQPSKKPTLSPSTRPMTRAATLAQVTTKSTKVSPPIVSDLCGIAQRGPKATVVKCHGYVFDTPQRRFTVSHPDDDNGLQKHITLRQVIDRNILSLSPSGLKDKLQVALALSASVLHLDGTPWLAQIVTLDDVVFMIEDENTANQQSCVLSQPFVIKRGPNTPELQHATPPTPTPPKQMAGAGRPINLAVMSLGSLLTQIMIDRVDDRLQMADTMDIGSIVSKREIVSQLEEDLLLKGGVNYVAAVTWCLARVYDISGLKNDMFCQNFLEAVVARLENDLEIVACDLQAKKTSRGSVGRSW